jgi:ferredoxin
MKVRVDASVCAGFGVCVGLAPDVFMLHDDGYAIVRVVEVPKELQEMVRAAASQCPSGAISLSEDTRS